jgi:hypothetical protein
MKNRLNNIANRQRSTRLPNVIFAICVALAAVVSVSGVATASYVANTHVAQP